MKPIPSSWTEKKRYVLIQTDYPVSRLLREAERMIGMLGMAQMRPVLLHTWQDDQWEYGILRISREHVQTVRMVVLHAAGFARVIALSGTLRGLRRKAEMNGITLPSGKYRGRRG